MSDKVSRIKSAHTGHFDVMQDPDVQHKMARRRYRSVGQRFAGKYLSTVVVITESKIKRFELD